MSITVVIQPGPDGVAKDVAHARDLRATLITPALDRGEHVTLEFGHARESTQPFVDILIGQALKEHGETLLERLEFRNCSPQLRGLVELVVNNALAEPPDPPMPPDLE
ncbi:STAS-like domain-containing protein [Longimicrobium sp.]|uniref:STAS-like domain-containing protein n=1 Tax=Longimicrobium sp. TaxID=2029185 RepID=UPI002BA01B46|nr:STAS-like domain-containing protein [Longimicrobium sp.]HSU12702.1 STAS-like domain-containing protein [Longimicrobium sp.]